jgi:hypothetical protein
MKKAYSITATPRGAELCLIGGNIFIAMSYEYENEVE